jgi:hypothetical protein
VQEVTMRGDRIIKAAYYLVASGFHWAMLFTNTGNYFHGGTPVEWIALQAMAVLIVVAAVKLVPKARTVEKIIMALCAVVPLISVVWALVEALRR